jgi:transposase
LARAIKKKAAGHTIVFADEAGFLMNPSVKATWAPVGQTPVVVYRNRHHKKVSVLGALAVFVDGHIEALTDWYPGAYVRGAEAARFLERLLAEVAGAIELVWDNLNAHKSPEVRAVLQEHGRLTLHYLPPYAPDLNPVEALWCQAKHHRMANHAIDDLETLEREARRHVRAIASEQTLLQACFGSAKLPLALYPNRSQ